MSLFVTPSIAHVLRDCPGFRARAFWFEAAPITIEVALPRGELPADANDDVPWADAPLSG